MNVTAKKRKMNFRPGEFTNMNGKKNPTPNRHLTILLTRFHVDERAFILSLLNNTTLSSVLVKNGGIRM